jgi:hypothetical protein
VRAGVYTSYFSVSVNPDFVTLDFGNALPEPGETKPKRNIIVSRVLISKQGARKLVAFSRGDTSKNSLLTSFHREQTCA